MQHNDAPGNGSDDGQSREQESCHFIPDMVAVANEEAAAEPEALQRLEPWTTDELRDRLEGLDGRDIEALDEIFKLFKVDEEPRGVAERLRLESGIRASAVHGLGPMGHARAMSGEGPLPYDGDPPDFLTATQPADAEKAVIAVVDTGIVGFESGGDTTWMATPSVITTRVEDYVGPDASYAGTDAAGQDLVAASHGTFVVSLIRKGSSNPVLFAAAQPRNGLTTDYPHDDDHGPTPTSELDVVAALGRLRNELAQREVAALNISLGAHSDRPCQDDFLLTVKLALAEWRRAIGSPIIAAGGNSTDPRPVYPAAFEGVTGVGALDGGRKIVWDAQGARVERDDRYWVDEYEQGVERVGLSGNPDHPIVKWGGSSFAAARHTVAVANMP